MGGGQRAMERKCGNGREAKRTEGEKEGKGMGPKKKGSVIRDTIGDSFALLESASFVDL